jgi:HK97 family phage major capsid protein
MKASIAVYERALEISKEKASVEQKVESVKGQPEVRSQYAQLLRQGVNAETRALVAGTDDKGGYLIDQESIMGEFIKALSNVVSMRQIARVLTPTRSQSGVTARLATQLTNAVWGTEISTIVENDSIVFGKTRLTPHAFNCLVKISKDLLGADGIDVVSIVNAELARSFGVTEEQAFLTGNAAGQPLGVFTVHASGVSSGRNVSTGNTTTAVKADGLIAAKYSLKAQYRASAANKWIMHKDVLLQVKQLKDGQGQYLFQPSLLANSPDTILGIPVLESEYAPNTLTTGLRVAVLGDFNYYWILDNVESSMQILLELYAINNQNGYIMRKRTDGMPVLEEAFVAVTLA